MGSKTEKTEQVQIQMLDSDGNWYTPHPVPAALAALRAISEDIRQYSGTYADGDLRKFREALRELDGVITARIGQPEPASPVAS